ncbi:uncharacterized protein LOC133180554 [Saccostrea echinata]|uniref:uncharacterized protein LOC133180554 n=1 Tax=Saccostrea echinata TaxID=191078 RepID=UPI002A81B641|nr:uncharacterized protein LOC133180554 [Saccostrea echinata]
MEQPIGAIISALIIVLSIAAYTHCQEPSEQNIDLLRQLLEDNIDIVPNEDLANDEEEELESGYIPLQVPESRGPSFEKRGFCGHRGCGRWWLRQRKSNRRQRRPKRLFCNFGGCFNGKRSLPLRSKFFLGGKK